MPESAVTHVSDPSLTGGGNSATLLPMTWQHPLSLSAAELHELLVQAELTEDEFYPMLLKNTYQVYRTGNVLALVVALPRRLIVLGMLAVGINDLRTFKSLAAGLKRLARAWSLTSIETSAYDPKVKRLLEMVGGKTIGWHMELRV